MTEFYKGTGTTLQVQVSEARLKKTQKQTNIQSINACTDRLPLSSVQLGPSIVSEWHPRRPFKKIAQIDLWSTRQDRGRRREGKVRTWRAVVSHCVCVHEKERKRQKERTKHKLPKRHQHCLPPTGKQRELKQEQESPHKSYFTICSFSLHLPPP